LAAEERDEQGRMRLSGQLEQNGTVCPDAAHGRLAMLIPEHRLSAGKALAAATREADVPGISRRLPDERLVPPRSGFRPRIQGFPVLRPAASGLFDCQPAIDYRHIESM